VKNVDVQHPNITCTEQTKIYHFLRCKSNSHIMTNDDSKHQGCQQWMESAEELPATVEILATAGTPKAEPASQQANKSRAG
jgi:hypothetical protein